MEVKTLNCIDPSDEAIQVAKKNLRRFKNCKFQTSGVMDNSLKENSQDFGYSLGVLHHTKDTRQGIKNCVKKLKKHLHFGYCFSNIALEINKYTLRNVYELNYFTTN